MNQLARVAAVGLIASSLTGCTYAIKLDANQDDARIFINGEPKGRGMVEHHVAAQYGYPETFGVKVQPKDRQAYSVEITRELDMPRAVIQTTVSTGLGLAYTTIDLANGRVPVTGLIFLAYAPLSWLQSYYYKPYYDLSKQQKGEARE